MFTKEITKQLSQWLQINFEFLEHSIENSCIFSKDNSSYIDYDNQTKEYYFLLVYEETSFQFYTKKLEFKVIYQAMKKHNSEVYSEAIRQSVLRSNVYKKLKQCNKGQNAQV